MELNADTRAFLDGTAFSSGQSFKIRRTPVRSRNTVLRDLARDRRVLHVGCADHVELIRLKRANGSYLHDRLHEVASLLIGLDNNEAALQQMRDLGIEGLFTPEQLPEGLNFDIVLAPDVIEHVPDVGGFLACLRSFDAPVVITTPNAFRWRNRTSLRSELVNTDHRYWFSPYTLCRSLTQAGFTITEVDLTDDIGRRRPLHLVAARCFPLVRDGLCVTAVPR